MLVLGDVGDAGRGRRRRDRGHVAAEDLVHGRGDPALWAREPKDLDDGGTNVKDADLALVNRLVLQNAGAANDERHVAQRLGVASVRAGLASAVVCGNDDDRVVIQPDALERVHKLAHEAVGATDGGHVLWGSPVGAVPGSVDVVKVDTDARAIKVLLIIGLSSSYKRRSGCSATSHAIAASAVARSSPGLLLTSITGSSSTSLPKPSQW